MRILFFLFLASSFLYGQENYVMVDNQDPKSLKIATEKITYKIQVLSSNWIDMDKFKNWMQTNICEVEYYKNKVGREYFRYLITPSESGLPAANKLLDSLTSDFMNPFIVVYYKGKRQN